MNKSVDDRQPNEDAERRCCLDPATETRAQRDVTQIMNTQLIGFCF